MLHNVLSSCAVVPFNGGVLLSGNVVGHITKLFYGEPG